MPHVIVDKLMFPFLNQFKLPHSQPIKRREADNSHDKDHATELVYLLDDRNPLDLIRPNTTLRLHRLRGCLLLWLLAQTDLSRLML